MRCSVEKISPVAVAVAVNGLELNSRVLANGKIAINVLDKLRRRVGNTEQRNEQDRNLNVQGCFEII